MKKANKEKNIQRFCVEYCPVGYLDNVHHCTVDAVDEIFAEAKFVQRFRGAMQVLEVVPVRR